MKKHIITLFIISVFAGASAQSYTQAFDSVFQHVNLRHTSTGILYERVLPLSNLTSYVTNIPHPVDTCDFWQFVMAYDELYHAGAQNTFLSDSVEGMINSLPVNNDIVTFGILHAKFNTFDTAAMRQRLYFDADSVLWEDISVHVSLFNENITFMMAPLVEYTSSPSVSFFVDHHFFFDNTNNPVTSLTIDFGDGYGERSVLFDTYVNINYPTNGIKIIRTVASFFNRDTIITYSLLKVGRDLREERSSHYNYTEDLTVYGQIIPPYPYSDGESFGISRGDIRIYYANSDMILRKPVLIVDGFDPGNNRTFEDNTDDDGKSLWDKLGDGLINNDNVGDMLLTLGYDVVLLDFPDGGTYIEQNAMVCIAAINKINERLQQSGSNEQIVVVGPSMGGQITRYALAYMEQHPNANTNYGHHNCRLWVSFDSPHQGANISMGVQAMVASYRWILSKLWDSTLCCKAAQQMLVYHKKNGAGTFNHMYYQQIANLSYPSMRKVAVSNGSLNNISNGAASLESLAIKAVFPYFIDVFTRNMAQQGSCKVYEIVRYIGFIPIPVSWTFNNDANRGSLDVAPGCKYYTFDIIVNKLLAFRILGLAFVEYNQHSHCFMPITSVLDINEAISYATDVSNMDLVAEGKVPFDSYWGPLNKNMEHITFDYDLVDYLLNEIETYIEGPREARSCTSPTYSLHLPQDSTATVTWTSSSNIHVVTGNDPYTVTIIPYDLGQGWIRANVSTLKHNKALTYSIEVLPYEDSTIPAINTTTIQGQNLTITTDSLLTDTFCIENGKTLTVKGTLYCSPSSRLIVHPGGKLVVDGGTLTSACDDVMWQGIEVVGDRTKRQLTQYQGKVVLCNGAVIENALCGIYTGLREDTVNYATAGGIIIADSACFRNNRRGVVINSYAYTNLSGTIENYSASFTRCTLTVDNSNLFAANNTSFAEHVRLWDVKGVVFDGCTFSNTANNLLYSGRGIYADDAGILVNTYCRPQVIYECECPEGDAKHNFFSGFSAAVEVNTTGNPYIVTVDGARFENNVTGVRINGNNHATVTRCRFDLSSLPGNSRGNYGLYLDGCTGYKVEQDTFLRAAYPSGPLAIDNSTGIYVSNSGASANSLYLNAFFNLTRGISVSGNNGQRKQAGLRISCNHFQGGKYDIYLNSGATIDYVQGTSTKGADNVFDNNSQNISNLYNSTASNITYYYYVSGTNLEPVHRTGVTPVAINNENSCASTLCNYNGGGSVYLAGFQSGMNAYVTALAENANADGTGMDETLAGMRQSLSETYYEAVRAIMSDTVLDLSQLEQWHAAAQPIADPYSLTETRFMEGYAETFAGNAENAEMANYAEFHAMKLALRNNDDAVGANNYSPLPPDGHINWYALTPAQIAQLQTIAERNTGRASVMAKGVLCFFFGICYDDPVETQDFASLQQGDDGNDTATTHAKRATTDIAGDAALTVYPNPTDDLLYIELSGAGIANIALYDLQGRAVCSQNPSSRTLFATVNIHNIPAGVYVLHVTDKDGKEYRQKVVRR